MFFYQELGYRIVEDAEQEEALNKAMDKVLENMISMDALKQFFNIGEICEVCGCDCAEGDDCQALRKIKAFLTKLEGPKKGKRCEH